MRFLSIILVILMIAASLTFQSNAESEQARFVFSAKSLTFNCIANSKVECNLAEDDSDEYASVIIAPGTYGLNDGLIDFSSQLIKFGDYPVMKFAYRTDSPSKKIDITTRSSVGEGWADYHPQNTSDGINWTEVIYDIKKVTKNKGVDLEQYGATIRIKPFGTGIRILEESYYFDLLYIGFFKTEADANAYKFNPDDDNNLPDEYYGKYIMDGTEKLAQLNKEFDARVQEIKSTPTNVNVTGTKYYVSSHGDDNNDGKTPDTPWKTLAKVDEYEFEPGDGVFFKRGEHFRANDVTLTLQSGVTYSAYGNGDKPVFVGSVNASSPRMWRETDKENVYKFIGKVTNSGSIIFDGGKSWGIRITRHESKENVTLDNGIVDNGFCEPYHSASRPWDGYNSLENELEFVSLDNFYLYCSAGNPGDVFDSIEISNGITGINGGSFENVTLDNLKLFAYGIHGISTSNVTNFTIQNCIFAWTGGSIHHTDSRLGNAVQNWGNADGFVIDNCWAYQTYDCCYTTQYTSDEVADLHIKNVEIKNSLAERSNSGPEIWNGSKPDGDKTYYDGVSVYNNYVRNGGYGWSHQRPLKDGNFYYGSAGLGPTEWKDFKFYDNYFFICSSVGLKTRYVSQYHSYFNGNTYILGEDKYLAQTSANLISVSGAEKLYPYNDTSVGAFKYYGVELDGEFYSVPAGYEPEPFDYKNAGDVYHDNSFADVKNHWASKDINYVTNAGYFNGISKLEFAPEASMTRAMLFTVLARLSGTELGETTPWYVSAIDFAVENGFTTRENSRPDASITRAELAVIIARYLKYKKASVNTTSQSFKDAAYIAKAIQETDDFDINELEKAISVCVNAGIINGYDDGTFKPQAKCTRAQIAAIIGRTSDYLVRCNYDFDAAIDDGSVIVLDGKMLYSILNDSKKKSTKTYSEDGYVRFVPVNTENGTVQIDLYQKNVEGLDVYKKKYVKFRYRLTRDADFVEAQTLDIGLRWPGEQWLSTYKRPVIEGFGEWQNGLICYDYFTANGKTKLPNESLSTYFYTIKPWGNNVVLSDEYYFDISDVAFFESEYMAEKYEF